MSKSIKERVHELERQNRLLTDNLVDSIWVVDAETMRYEFAAPPRGRQGMYAGEELIGKPFFEELTPASKKKATDLLRKEANKYKAGKHTSQSLELELAKKGGGTYWIEIRAKLLAEPGDTLKIVGITRDITERKTAELQLERLNKSLLEALSEKEKLQEEVKMLRDLLPICSGCKRIRDEDGKWWPLDVYVKTHTDTDFTHTICPDCKDVIYPDLT